MANPTSNNGIQIRADGGLDDALKPSIVFIISSRDRVEFHDPRLVNWLRAQARKGAIPAPLGSATVLAAERWLQPNSAEARKILADNVKTRSRMAGTQYSVTVL
jgi:transcriptional regulator GlxA family with amidase domain